MPGTLWVLSRCSRPSDTVPFPIYLPQGLPALSGLRRWEPPSPAPQARVLGFARSAAGAHAYLSYEYFFSGTLLCSVPPRLPALPFSLLSVLCESDIPSYCVFIRRRGLDGARLPRFHMTDKAVPFVRSVVYLGGWELGRFWLLVKKKKKRKKYPFKQGQELILEMRAQAASG